MVMASRFKGIVFDFDGVILDSESSVISCWKIVAEEEGIEGIEDHCRECLGLNRNETRIRFNRRYNGTADYEELTEKRRKVFWEMFDQGLIPLKPGAKELLQYLSENGYKIALASSTNKSSIIHETEFWDIRKYFDVLVCGDMVNRSKPAPDIFLEAARRIGLEPHECIGIEDSLNGLRACHKAGLFTVMVPDLLEPNEETQNLTDKVYSSLMEVQQAIENNTLIS